jgi:hypothetical protein
MERVINKIAMSVTAFWVGMMLPASGAPVPPPSPELIIQVGKGQEISVSALRGQVSVLEFMSTTCPNCQATAANAESAVSRIRNSGISAHCSYLRWRGRIAGVGLRKPIRHFLPGRLQPARDGDEPSRYFRNAKVCVTASRADRQKGSNSRAERSDGSDIATE